MNITNLSLKSTIALSSIIFACSFIETVNAEDFLEVDNLDGSFKRPFTEEELASKKTVKDMKKELVPEWNKFTNNKPEPVTEEDILLGGPGYVVGKEFKSEVYEDDDVFSLEDIKSYNLHHKTTSFINIMIKWKGK